MVNMYLQSGDPAMAAAQGKRIAARVAAYGGPAVMIGDWNTEPTEAPALSLTASGMMHLCDSINEELPSRTRPSGRYIDFGLASMSAMPQRRWQTRGCADHDLVAYGWRVDAMEPTYCRQRARRLCVDEEVSEEAWQQHWHRGSTGSRGTEDGVNSTAGRGKGLRATFIKHL